MKKLWRNYFWQKRWYRYWILYRLNLFLGKSYLKDGWHTKTPMEYLELSLRRIEKKYD